MHYDQSPGQARDCARTVGQGRFVSRTKGLFFPGKPLNTSYEENGT